MTNKIAACSGGVLEKPD